MRLANKAFSRIKPNVFLPFRRWTHVERHPLDTEERTAQPCTLGNLGSSTCSCACGCVVSEYTKKNHTITKCWAG